MSKTLLWTNSNMTDKYAFNVALDLSSYDMVIIKHRSHFTTEYNNSYDEVFAFIDNKQYQLYHQVVSSGYSFWRFFTPSASGISFTTSYWATQGANSISGSGRDVCVPYQIYGIKF